ncbi:MAG TPA: DUF4296 domain-containing protein [Flavobacterium sp.]|jgi:hypothetical protein
MRKLTAIFSLLFVLACGETTVEKPEQLIEESVMVDIFYDLAVLDAMRTQKPQSLSGYALDPDQYVYKKYKIDSVRFAKSNRYYASQIETYKSMYDRVADRLQNHVDKLDPKPKKTTSAILEAK